MKQTTLCYIRQGSRYLMLHRVKKQQDENKDKWIGVGGKLEYGESPIACVRREITEETGLTVEHPDFRGIITFVSDEWGVEYMYLFTADQFSGSLSDCDEGELEWVDFGADGSGLARLNLWEGDRIFLQLLQQEAPFFFLTLQYQGETLISHQLEFAQHLNDAR